MAPPSFWSPLRERALRVAAHAHRDQRRKTADTPYITHPIAVAAILQSLGVVDDELLAAALLHDVVEDSSVTLTDLQSQFPERTVTAVAWLSEVKCDSTGTLLPWAIRKAEHLARLAAAPVEVRLIKLADLYHNLWCIEHDVSIDRGHWRVFSAPPSSMLAKATETMTRLAPASDASDAMRQLATGCQTLVRRLEALLP